MKIGFKIIALYSIVFVIVISLVLTGNRLVTAISQQWPLSAERYIVIDAGHGGIDGGATSCTGILESRINLEIALRLNDLLHLMGVHTIMIRSDDRSVYTSGQTIAAKKVSDLKERVRLVNDTPNAILVSIHQNTFPDRRYYGAQVFYGNAGSSKELAQQMQSDLVSTLNPGSSRTIKPGDGIFLLDKINTTGILIECGFISNPEEEAKLRDCAYQKKLACVVACVCSRYLSFHGT